MQPLAEDLLDGAAAAATYLGLKPRTVYALVSAGELPAVKKGRKLFFRKSELDRAFQTAA
ncbi:helix-turn-helix domain-containing protein [Pelagerythrobacter marinus]|nr:helix-turn-helix domain-containing protein [Pelagerythrobacter marinus]